MHILEIPTFFPPYGGLFCLEQAKALRARGHEVRIISSVLLSLKAVPKAFLTYPFRHYWHEMDGIEVLQTYPRSLPGMYHRNIRVWVNSVMQLFEEYVARYGTPDVLHVHNTHWAAVAARDIKQRYGVPFVVTEHNSQVCFDDQDITPSSWQAEAGRKALNEASAIIHVSEENRQSVAQILGNECPSHVVSNIVDTSFFTPSAAVPPTDTFRFCCAAVMLPGKGYDILLEAFRILGTLTNRNVELHIAGRGTSVLKRSLNDRRIKVYDHLNRDGILRMLQSSHCFVLATRSESQGLVLMEAMSCGLPYVSTEAIPECLRISDAAHIVPIDDAQAFAHAMLHVIQTYDYLTSQRHRFHDAMVQFASPSAFGQKFNAILETIVRP